MIEIRNLSFRYARSKILALDDISVDFPRERVFAVMGESGSGKTTLLNCIARFVRPAKGTITLEGTNVNAMSESELRRTLGVVFQRLYLFPHLTVLQNMTLAPEKAFRQDRQASEREAAAMLDRLGIADLGKRYPSQISGGQAQRVAIARGLMLKPHYMLLDEPTSALDAKTTAEFSAWLGELREDTSFVIVTHDLPFAGQVATHGVFLEEGRVQATGKVEDIIHQVQGTL